jgi:uncharacterized membrane protein YfcA
MTSPLSDYGLPSDVLLWQAVLLSVVSLGVGVLGGLVGLALGTMRLPALLLLGVPPSIAAGTNILVSTSTAAVGALRHLRAGRVNKQVVLVMGGPSVAGALAGGLLSDRAPETLLIGVAGVLVLWQGAELTLRAYRERKQNTQQAPPGVLPYSKRLALEGGLGLVIGLIGGAVGLILGSLRLPVLIRVLRMDPRTVPGTNLLIGFTMGAAGWIGHASRNQVDYPVMVSMIITGAIGMHYGARLTGRVSLATLLLIMGLVLSVVGALLVGRGVVEGF